MFRILEILNFHPCMCNVVFGIMGLGIKFTARSEQGPEVIKLFSMKKKKDISCFKTQMLYLYCL